MKKLFYSLMFMGITTAAFAQSAKQVPETIKFLKHSSTEGVNDKPSVEKPMAPDAHLRGEAVWSDDFSDASQWATFNSSEPTPVDWEIITDNEAAPFAGLNPMMLPTAENGFGFINADAGGTGSIQNATLHTVNPIDLSAIDNLALQFFHVTRNFATTYSVVYSLDAGDTWNVVPLTSVPPSGNDNSANTSNPQLAIVDLTEELANQPQVWLGFRYVADWGWFWAVDDVSIIESPDNYITLNNAYYDEWPTINDPDLFNGLFGPDINMVESYEYAFYSGDQVRPLSFTADVANLGTQPQTNVTFTATLTDAEGTVTEYTETLETLQPGERTFIIIEDVVPAAFNLGDPETPAIAGEYTVSFSVDQDEEDFFPDDNVVADKSFRVVEEYTSHNANASFGYFTTLAGAEYEAFSRFAYDEETEVDYIEFAVTAGTADAENALFESIGLDIFTGSVYANQDAPNDVLESFFIEAEGEPSSVSYFITDTEIFNATPVAADEVNWVRVMLPEPLTLNPGVIYNASIIVGTAPGGVPNLLFPLAGGGSSTTASHYFGPYDGEPEVSLFIGGTAFTIRMGYAGPENTTGSDPVTFRLGQNYPNPVNGSETLIDWELLEPAENITFTVHDMNGRVVDQRDLGDRPAGKQETLRINTNLAAGVYQYSLIVGNYRAVRKMVVTK